MLIKSLLKREGGSKIEFGQDDEDKTIYHFNSKTKDGDHVCEVTDKGHIQKLLSIAEGYEIADEEVKKPNKPKDDGVELKGSEWEPVEFEYGDGKKVSTKDLVEFVFSGAKVTKEVWNAMDDEQIKEALDQGLVQYAKKQEKTKDKG